jgi:hypothetical protein
MPELVCVHSPVQYQLASAGHHLYRHIHEVSKNNLKSHCPLADPSHSLSLSLLLLRQVIQARPMREHLLAIAKERPLKCLLVPSL